MPSFPDFLAELNADLAGLRNAVFHLAHTDDVFWQVQAILQANTDFKNDGAIFQEWMESCYADSMVVGLRRLVDPDRRTLSLHLLLEKIKPRATEFTREWYVDLHRVPLHHNADLWFTELIGGPHRSLTAAVVESKQEELKSSLKIVKDFTDQFVAHSDTKPTAPPPTFNDVRQAIASAFQVLRWLSSIIDSTAMASPVPVIQPNWLINFRVPWLKPGQNAPAYVHLDDLLKKAPPGMK